MNKNTILLIVSILCISVYIYVTKIREGLSGFGITSGLNLYNSSTHCWPGSPEQTAGCSTDGKVII